VKRVLIANRGEIALRIIRALRELDIESVVVYSEADSNSLPVQLADRAICVGPSDPTRSYLNLKSIITAALITDCDAIHPGYGFLAENAIFAEMCQDVGLTFIGPEPEHIRIMGNKIEAVKFAKKAGVSVVPGSGEEIRSLDDAVDLARDVGYPVMIKAAAGGGGRGMRLVRSEEELLRTFDSAAREAEIAFGDSTLYIEKCIINARHIEVQVFGDKSGKVLHFGERECSLQRRHQKVLEEAPAVIDEKVRRALWRDAVLLAESMGYVNAGTVEFLVDENGNHYFIEMNTRIQVEHPVTEMVTGYDLVKLQIEVARGKPFKFSQEDVKIRGWSIEMRVNAEDPVKFAPSPGKIVRLIFPGGPNVRVDSAVYQGYEIPPFYDSMIAKIIVYGKNRLEAIKTARRVVRETVIEGVKTNLPLFEVILNHPDFVEGSVHVRWLEENLT
jgi:acetyl-CoA carboxylase biotin carboxylase subunit